MGFVFLHAFRTFRTIHCVDTIHPPALEEVMSHKFRYIIYTFSLFLCSAVVCIGKNANVQQELSGSRENAIVKAVEYASPAVVNISTTRIQEYTVNPFFQDLWSPFFDMPFQIPQKRELHGLGSGIVISGDGYILTNQHVIEGADFVEVILFDGKEFEALVVGLDQSSDLAVLKIEPSSQLLEIQFGDSSDLMIGEWAVAIGHPFASAVGNPKPTVTIGVVSATNRTLKAENRLYRHLIQTDASINPGNSGGALVNLHGQLIGVNTAIYSTSGGSQGIGFAIPADIAQKVVGRIIEHGAIIPPVIGLKVQNLTQDLAEAVNSPEATGVLVTQVEDGSIVALSGIKRGDVITRINGQTVMDQDEYHSITRLIGENEDITFQVFRAGSQQQIKITIKELQRNYVIDSWKLKVRQQSRKDLNNYSHRGVIVSRVRGGSELARKGLRRGDLIYKLGNVVVDSLENFKRIVIRLRRNQRFSLFFERDREEWAIRNLVIQ